MRAFVQTIGLHPGVALFVVAVDVMLFGADITGVGWLLSCAVAAVVTVPCYLMQRKSYGDEREVALAKAMMVGLLTAIPTPLPGFLTATAGVVGIGGRLLGCGRRRAVPLPEVSAGPVGLFLCCPSCGHQGQWQSRYEGREVICSKCRHQFAAAMTVLGVRPPSKPRRSWAARAALALAGCLAAAFLIGALTEAFREKPAVIVSQPLTDMVPPEPVYVSLPPDTIRRLPERMASPGWSPPPTTAERPVFPPPESGTEAVDEDRAVRAIAKILGAAGTDIAGKRLEMSITEDWRPLLGPAVRELARFGRDELIESALYDVFPELSDRAIRATRLVISLVLDDRLNLRDLAIGAAKDEVIHALKRHCPDLWDADKVADFIVRLHGSR